MDWSTGGTWGREAGEYESLEDGRIKGVSTNGTVGTIMCVCVRVFIVTEDAESNGPQPLKTSSSPNHFFKKRGDHSQL